MSLSLPRPDSPASDGGYRVRHPARPDLQWTLAAGRYRIGRAQDAELRLSHPTVSRWHAEIEVLESGVVVTDLGSTNGVWLGNRRIRRIANAGDFDLRVGALSLEFFATGQSQRSGGGI